MLLFLETIMASFANVLATRISSCLCDNEHCQDLQVFLLKHQDQCLVTMLYKMQNIALKLSNLLRME